MNSSRCWSSIFPINGGSRRKASNSTPRAIDITHRTVVAENYYDADVEQVLFTVETATGSHRYQIWIGWCWQVPDRLAHATIGSAGRPDRL